MENDKINKIIDNLKSEETHTTYYANEAEKIKFLTDNIQKINKKKIMLLNVLVDRIGTIGKFALLLKDIDAALKIEAGIFEFTLIYVVTKNYTNKIMPAIYNDKINDLFLNLDENSSVENKYLRKAILNGVIDPQKIPFLLPQELHPERWKDLIRKKNLREEKKKNMACTDLYQCWKCKARRCRMIEMQLRSADEPMTKFITCLECFTVMKK
jgi:DNA-directed RNA polymerase subunit M/transcription elongation factor TFIIS